MIYIISGTNRPKSKTKELSTIILNLYKEAKVSAELISLDELELNQAGNIYGTAPEKLKAVIQKLNSARGIHFVVPEYNGSMPGILKYFIDFFDYPVTFESRPVCFVGLGWRWGGLRPVEHLQGVFGYRNAFMFPQRVFVTNAPNIIVDGAVSDAVISNLLKDQVRGFNVFIEALENSQLDANSVLAKKTKK